MKKRSDKSSKTHATAQSARPNLSRGLAIALTLAVLAPLADLAQQALDRYKIPRDTVTIPFGAKVTLDKIVTDLAQRLNLLLTDKENKEVRRIFSAAYPQITNDYLDNLAVVGGGTIDTTLMVIAIQGVKELNRHVISHVETHTLGRKTINAHFSEDTILRTAAETELGKTFGDQIIIHMNRIYDQLKKANRLEFPLFARRIRRAIVHELVHTDTTLMLLNGEDLPFVAQLLTQMDVPSNGQSVVDTKSELPSYLAEIYTAEDPGEELLEMYLTYRKQIKDKAFRNDHYAKKIIAHKSWEDLGGKGKFTNEEIYRAFVMGLSRQQLADWAKAMSRKGYGQVWIFNPSVSEKTKTWFFNRAAKDAIKAGRINLDPLKVP